MIKLIQKIFYEFLLMLTMMEVKLLKLIIKEKKKKNSEIMGKAKTLYQEVLK